MFIVQAIILQLVVFVSIGGYGVGPLAGIDLRRYGADAVIVSSLGTNPDLTPRPIVDLVRYFNITWGPFGADASTEYVRQVPGLVGGWVVHWVSILVGGLWQLLLVVPFIGPLLRTSSAVATIMYHVSVFLESHSWLIFVVCVFVYFRPDDVDGVLGSGCGVLFPSMAANGTAMKLHPVTKFAVILVGLALLCWPSVVALSMAVHMNLVSTAEGYVAVAIATLVAQQISHVLVREPIMNKWYDYLSAAAENKDADAGFVRELRTFLGALLQIFVTDYKVRFRNAPLADAAAATTTAPAATTTTAPAATTTTAPAATTTTPAATTTPVTAPRRGGLFGGALLPHMPVGVWRVLGAFVFKLAAAYAIALHSYHTSEFSTVCPVFDVCPVDKRFQFHSEHLVYATYWPRAIVPQLRALLISAVASMIARLAVDVFAHRLGLALNVPMQQITAPVRWFVPRLVAALGFALYVALLYKIGKDEFWRITSSWEGLVAMTVGGSIAREMFSLLVVESLWATVAAAAQIMSVAEWFWALLNSALAGGTVFVLMNGLRINALDLTVDPMMPSPAYPVAWAYWKIKIWLLTPVGMTGADFDSRARRLQYKLLSPTIPVVIGVCFFLFQLWPALLLRSTPLFVRVVILLGVVACALAATVLATLETEMMYDTTHDAWPHYVAGYISAITSGAALAAVAVNSAFAAHWLWSRFADACSGTRPLLGGQFVPPSGRSARRKEKKASRPAEGASGSEPRGTPAAPGSQARAPQTGANPATAESSGGSTTITFADNLGASQQRAASNSKQKEDREQRGAEAKKQQEPASAAAASQQQLQLQPKHSSSTKSQPQQAQEKNSDATPAKNSTAVAQSQPLKQQQQPQQFSSSSARSQSQPAQGKKSEATSSSNTGTVVVQPQPPKPRVGGVVKLDGKDAVIVGANECWKAVAVAAIYRIFRFAQVVVNRAEAALTWPEQFTEDYTLPREEIADACEHLQTIITGLEQHETLGPKLFSSRRAFIVQPSAVVLGDVPLFGLHYTASPPHWRGSVCDRVTGIWSLVNADRGEANLGSAALPAAPPGYEANFVVVMRPKRLAGGVSSDLVPICRDEQCWGCGVQCGAHPVRGANPGVRCSACKGPFKCNAGFGREKRAEDLSPVELAAWMCPFCVVNEGRKASGQRPLQRHVPWTIADGQKKESSPSSSSSSSSSSASSSSTAAAASSSAPGARQPTAADAVAASAGGGNAKHESQAGASDTRPLFTSGQPDASAGRSNEGKRFSAGGAQGGKQQQQQHNQQQQQSPVQQH